jgi:hypothetical protein
VTITKGRKKSLRIYILITNAKKCMTPSLILKQKFEIINKILFTDQDKFIWHAENELLLSAFGG